MCEIERYQEFFNERGDTSDLTQQYFWLSIEGHNNLYDNAIAVAENVIPSMDSLFTSRKGSELGFRVIGNSRQNIAAVVWTDTETNEVFTVLMTDGRDIITADPCFIPTNKDGLDIGINDYKPATSTAYNEVLPWFKKAQQLIYRHFSQKTDSPPEIFLGIRVEEMSSRLERKLNNGAVKVRRSHF